VNRITAPGSLQVPESRKKLGLGIFPSPSTYTEGKISEFFQVPAPT